MIENSNIDNLYKDAILEREEELDFGRRKVAELKKNAPYAKAGEQNKIQGDSLDEQNFKSSSAYKI